MCCDKISPYKRTDANLFKIHMKEVMGDGAPSQATVFIWTAESQQGNAKLACCQTIVLRRSPSDSSGTAATAVRMIAQSSRTP